MSLRIRWQVVPLNLTLPLPSSKSIPFHLLLPANRYFSIDGVLLKSKEILPGASEALNFLQANRIPFILLTNGGGSHESDRVKDLSKKLQVPLTEDNFVQSHTPFKLLLKGEYDRPSLQDKTVLAVGGIDDKCRQVAYQYGFRSVVTTSDLLKAYPKIWACNQIWSDHYERTARPLPKNPDNPAASLRFGAILVFSSPRDYALDLQIILDLLMSENGVLGTVSEKNGDDSLHNRGWQQDGQPAVFFSNPDLVWATDYPQPRLGQGAFQASIAGVWAELTDNAHFERTVCGKPHATTYQYAEIVLNEYREKLLGREGSNVPPLERVFMVGDNPESDIRGANEFQSEHHVQWSSILVETGVYKSGGKPPKYTPEVTLPNVADAVRWALAQQGWRPNQ